MKREFCLTSKDVVQAAMEASNKTLKDFEVDPNILIIFSGGLLNYLKVKSYIRRIRLVNTIPSLWR